ncbi:hypothetical protein RN001_011449 [Aquatica leii]|uniref:Uncharacterized protein n=1 Tax=Aquatica leii TaxID=1421715 RepID=A0AAN7SCU4_9COLE|nr:hypothetical protein RN001_011449 [Aquatica leii]
MFRTLYIPATIICHKDKLQEELEHLMKGFIRNGTNIRIENDLTVKEREIQAHIKAFAEKARNEGKRAKIVGYQKLIVDGKEWRWNPQKKELEEADKSTRGPEIYSDHYLVVAKLRVITEKEKTLETNTRHRTRVNEKIKTYKLQETETASKYRKNIEEKIAANAD